VTSIRPLRARLVALAAAAVLLRAGTPATVAAPITGALPCDLATTERIVAIGDVHGAYDRFIALLRAAGLIDARQRWTGGRAVLVQTGDVVDRGPDSRRALDLLRRLEGEASRAGGRVVPLLGNHEVMGMLGDLSYVSAGEYAAFRSADSEELRERYYRVVADNAAARARAAGQPFDEAAFRARFLDATPLGSVELQLAFGPNGEYGRWFRQRHAAVKINDMIFVHGGISPDAAALGCAGISETVRAELKAIPVRDPAQLATFLITSDDGPLWYRGLALEPEIVFSAEVDRILERLKARTIVVGHTVAAGARITARFGGRVVQIDTGMLGGSFFPGGRASALEIHNGRFTAIYEDGREDLPIRPVPQAAAAPSAIGSAAGYAELGEPGCDRLTMGCRAHPLVDIEDAAVDADVERPARRVRLIGIDHSVRLRDAACRIAQERIIDAERLGKGLVRFGRIDAGGEIRHVERPNLVATLTE
jgi:hypothetical protein